MVVFLAALYWEKLKALFKNPSKSVFVSFVVLALFLLPMFYQLFTSAGRARYSWVQILDEGAIARINEARSLGGSRVVHNKMTYFLFDFSKNYLAHFSLSFLFLDGGTNYQFSVPERGLLYFIDLPFLLLGFFFLTKRAIMGRGKTALLLLFWLFLAPIASSLTREAPHVLRSITFLPVPMIISSYGIAQVGSRVAKRANLYLYLCFLLVLSFVAINYMRDYFRRYRINYSQAWQYGYQQVADFIGEYYSNYDKIVVTKKYGEPHEFLLFYLKWPPEKYLTDSTLNRFFQTNWFWVDGFDKFYFVNDWQVKNQGLGDYTFKQESEELVQCDPEVVNCLLITTKGNVPGGWNRIKYVNFLNGQTAFELYEN